MRDHNKPVRIAQPISTEEAIHRIREGRHVEFAPEDDDSLLERALIQLLEEGHIEAGLTEDGRLAFRKPTPCRHCGGPDDHGRDCLPGSQGGTQHG